jgi:outer membrane protein assembly factor BamB
MFITRRSLAVSVVIGAGVASASGQLVLDTTKVFASDAELSGQYGSAVAIDGHLAVVGAPRNSAAGSSAGAAYILDVSDPSNPVELFRLEAADAAPSDQFGTSVAISGTTVVIGAPGRTVDGLQGAGVAFVFDALTGQQIAILEPSTRESQDGFGRSVAVAGGDAFVGAPGSGVRGAIYRFDAATGAEIIDLRPVDPRCCLSFGQSFAVSGDRLIAGTPSDRATPTMINAGSVFVFDLATNTQVGKFFADEPAFGMKFGERVALDGDIAVVATTVYTDNPPVFIFDLATGEQTHRLVDETEFGFGSAVAVDDGRVLVGRPSGRGTVKLYDAQSGDLVGDFVARDSRPNQEFGNAAAIDGPVAIVGAAFDDDFGVWNGAAYVFLPQNFSGPCGPADLAEPFGSVTFFDLTAFITLFVAGDAGADLAEPFGTINFLDIAAYLDLFNAGCP